MTRVLLTGQDKGGVGKSLTVRALAEAVPAAPIIEIDSTRRLLELEDRVSYFPMRADRGEIERSGGRAARSEYDGVVAAIASATLPTIVDVGANTARTLMTVLADLRDDLKDADVELGLLVIVTAEPGARSEAPKLMGIGKGWTERFLLENRVRGPVDPSELKKTADGATLMVLDEHVMEDEAVKILQAGGLALIPKLDAAKINASHGMALGSRIRRDLTRLRADAMEAVRPAAAWLVGGA